MKKLSCAAIVFVTLLTLSAAAVYAQSTGTWFKVPFAFNVADNAMPAGQYYVESLYWNAVAIHHAKGEAGLVLLAKQTGRAADGNVKLVFHRYGDRYFLVEAQLPNMDTGRAFYAGKEEQEIAQAQNRPATVEIAGR
jgi:hypothetical protein